MRSAAYWERAALLREIAVQTGATYTAEEVLRLYDGALDDIQGEIRKIKYNFGKRYGIDEVTAEYHISRAMEEDNLRSLIKLLEDAPNEQARRDILEYIHRDGLSVRAYSARIERYEQLKSVIYTKIKNMAVKETSLVGALLKRAYKESYYGMIDDTAKGLNAGIGFAVLNDRAIDEAVNAKWHGKRFSERIWGNTDDLAKEAQELISKAIISGESYAKTAQKLADRFGVDKFHAVTLVRTETSHIHAVADKKAYEDLGITEYKYLATLDDRTCETCGALDGKVFKLSEAREGVNYPSMHPRCRCTTTMNKPYIKRSARDPLSGKSVYVDGDLDYTTWKESLTPEQREALELAKRKDSRRSADKLQYKQYQDVLGKKNVPSSFDKFQELKYNSDGAEYEDLEYYYRGINNGTVIKNAAGQYVKIAKHASLQERPNSIIQITNSKGGISRNYYGGDGWQTKQISNNSHGHKAVENYGKHGEHAHDYIYDDDKKLVDRPYRELNEQERKENSDIL